MIWLVWRRSRVLFVLTIVALAGLGLWMVLLGHALVAATTSHACTTPTGRCPVYAGAFALSNQALALNLLLLAVPCLLGVVFGAPLVAGELERNTNRLVWTQGTSRTRWLIVKWLIVGLVLAVVVAILSLVTQWWTGHVHERIFLNFGEGAGNGRLQPLYFPVTGVAFCANTIFAFALGAALGAVIRKVSWAIVGTIVIYAAVSILMVVVVRPSLAPQLFVPFPGMVSNGQIVNEGVMQIPADAWNLGSGFRYEANVTGNVSADAVAQACENRHPTLYEPYLDCLQSHKVRMGEFYQAGDHYWPLQWRESGLLVVASGLLFGVTLWSVRRWRA